MESLLASLIKICYRNRNKVPKKNESRVTIQLSSNDKARVVLIAEGSRDYVIQELEKIHAEIDPIAGVFVDHERN